jgi:HK97 family phage prohead protease
MVDRRTLIDAPERRSIAASDFDIRSDGDSLTLTGYASIFDYPYDVMGGAPRGWTEIVDRRAFDVTLGAKPDVHLLINHEGMPLARTKSGTLHLSTDGRGLKVSADLDRRDPDVQRLETKMQRGDMDEMSFAFRVKADKWSDDDSQRRLTEVSLHKGDVSVVNFGASDATSAQLNSLRSALDVVAGCELEEALAELRSADGDVLGRLAEAERALAALRRSMTPKASRTLSLAEALKISAE